MRSIKRFLHPQTPLGAYVFVAWMFTAAAIKLSLDYGESANLEDYLWRLFWAGASTGWAARYVYLGNSYSDGPEARTLRGAGATVAAMMIVGVAVC